MGFKGNRIYLLLGAIFLLILIGIGALTSQPGASGPTPSPTPPPVTPYNNIATVTISDGFGIARVRIFNINTAERTNRTLTDLPFQFSVEKGQYLQIYVTTLEGYEWDSWWIVESSTFDHNNPFTFRVDGDTTLQPHVLMNGGV